jgi:hypothetical protein
MTEIKGVDVIRQKLINSNRKLNMAGFASDVGLAPHQVSAFMEGRAVPPVAALRAMAKRFWSNAEYDVESGMLRQANHEPPQPVGSVVAPPAIPNPHYYHPEYFPTLRSDKPEPVKPKRPGWL